MISTVVSVLLRLALVLVSLLGFLVLVAIGVCTLVAVLIWSLLRGRKPVIDVSGFARARRAAAWSQHRGAHAPRGMGAAEVVDVEAREVGTPGSSMPRLK